MSFKYYTDTSSETKAESSDYPAEILNRFL